MKHINYVEPRLKSVKNTPKSECTIRYKGWLLEVKGGGVYKERKLWNGFIDNQMFIANARSPKEALLYISKWIAKEQTSDYTGLDKKIARLLGHRKNFWLS